jgi:hypothetical protein
MTDRDDDTFNQFAERFARIEPLVSDRPTTNARPRTVRRVAVAVATVALIVAAVGLGGVVLGGRLASSGPAASGAVAVKTIAPTIGPSTAASPPGQPSSDPVSLVPLDPAQPPRELPPPCLIHMTTTDQLITTPAQDATSSLTVLIGRVSDVGSAQWNTPDGQPPGKVDLDAGSVLRLVRIEVESTIRGVAVPSVITVWILGGTIGCQQYLIGGFPRDVAIGDRYVVFLRSGLPRTGLTRVFQAWQLWSIRGDSVATESTPNVRLEELLDQLRSGAAASKAP